VAFYTVNGGGHLTPSIQSPVPPVVESVFGRQNHDIETAEEIWRSCRASVIRRTASPNVHSDRSRSRNDTLAVMTPRSVLTCSAVLLVTTRFAASAGAVLCPAAPRPACRTAVKSKLEVKRLSDDRRTG